MSTHGKRASGLAVEGGLRLHRAPNGVALAVTEGTRAWHEIQPSPPVNGGFAAAPEMWRGGLMKKEKR